MATTLASSGLDTVEQAKNQVKERLAQSGMTSSQSHPRRLIRHQHGGEAENKCEDRDEHARGEVDDDSAEELDGHRDDIPVPGENDIHKSILHIRRTQHLLELVQRDG